MSGYILREEEKNIVLTAGAVERLVGCGNGDAALLYLELQRLSTGVTASQLMQRLRWSQLRLDAAEAELQRLGLLPGAVVRKPLEAPDERVFIPLRTSLKCCKATASSKCSSPRWRKSWARS